MAELFGFEIKRRKESKAKESNIPSFVAPSQDDGAMNLAATGTAASSFLDMDGTARSEAELVAKYRSMLQHG